MRESLLSTSFSRFKKNSGSYIAVGIFSGLFLILAATLSLIDISFTILAMPFITLPFLFASHVACYYLEANQPITISAVARYFFGFFNPQFRGSFRGIRAFLTSLAVYFGFMILAYVIMYSVFRNNYGETFTESFKSLITTYYSSENSYEDLLNLLNDNEGLLLTFFIYVSSLPLPFAIIWFIYSISFSSISLYYRLNIRASVASLIRLAIGSTYAKYKSKMRKDWFKLNWPLLLLSLVGSITGALIAVLVIKDAGFFSALISLGSVSLLFIFLPFYYANMEVIYHRYEDAFKEGNKIAVENVLMRIQNSIDLSEEEKRSLEQSFKDDDPREEE